MKKLFWTAALAAMMLLPLGTTALAGVEDAPPIPEMEYQPGSAPAQNDISSMAPAIHAVLLAMENQKTTDFTPEDTALAWEMLYNLLSMYGQMDERATYQDEVLLLPVETVMDYSGALFAAPLSPDDLPEELADRITYDPIGECYRLYPGSDALAEVRIADTQDLGDQVAVTGSLVYLAEEAELAAFTAQLELSENMFGYVLTELNIA